MEHLKYAPLQAYGTDLAFTWDQLQKLTMPRLLPLKALSHLRGSETSQYASADHASEPSISGTTAMSGLTRVNGWQSKGCKSRRCRKANCHCCKCCYYRRNTKYSLLFGVRLCLTACKASPVKICCTESTHMLPSAATHDSIFLKICCEI